MDARPPDALVQVGAEVAVARALRPRGAVSPRRGSPSEVAGAVSGTRSGARARERRGDGALDRRDHGMRALGEDLSGGWRGTDGGRVRRDDPVRGWDLARETAATRVSSKPVVGLRENCPKPERRARRDRVGSRVGSRVVEARRSTRTTRSRRSAARVSAVAPESTSSRTSSRTSWTHLLADADESVVHDGAVAALDVEEGVVEAVRAAAEHGGLHDPRDEPRVRQLHVSHVLHDRLDRAPRL